MLWVEVDTRHMLGLRCVRDPDDAHVPRCCPSTITSTPLLLMFSHTGTADPSALLPQAQVR